MKKLTYADQAKRLIKKFEGRNDKASQDTLKSLMQDLRNRQEAEKATMEPNPNSNQAGDGMLFPNPMAAFGGPGQMMTGAAQQGAQAGVAANTAAVPGAGPSTAGVIGMAGTALDLGKMAFGPSGIDTSGAQEVRAGDVKVGNAAASGAMKGAQAGMALGPWGAAGGALIGGVAGLIGGNKAKKDAFKGERNFDGGVANRKGPQNYAEGGLVTDPPSKLSVTHPIDGPNPEWKPMPSNIAPETQANLRTSWGRQMKMGASNVGGFEDQRDYEAERKAKYMADTGEAFKTWRAGRTGVSPNNKFSQTSPEYQAAWETIRSKWYKENPHQVNAEVQAVADERQSNRQYGNGGKLELPDLTNNFQKFGDANRVNDVLLPDYKAPDNIMEKINPSYTPNLQDKYTGKNPTGKAKKAVNWLGENAGQVAQYAGAIAPLFNKIERASTPRGTRLEGKTTLDRIDEESLANKIRGSVNVAGSARETSGGSLAAYRSGTQLGNKQLLEAISGSNIAARQANLQQGNVEAQMNQQERMTNMAADDRFLERSAQDEGAYQTAKQANRAAIFDNISAIGREETDKKIVKEMYGYKWNGKYWVDPKGKKVSNAEYENVLASNKKQMQSMFGGYLKK